MALKDRRTREKQERSESILDAAEQAFFRKGFSQTTMDEIARGAGLSRALLYVYFEDKAAIMRGIMLRATQDLEQRFRIALENDDSGLAQIEGIGHAYYAFSTQSSDYFDVLTDLHTFPMPQEGDPQMAELGSCRERITGLMVEALEHGLQDDSIDKQHVSDPLQTAYYLQGALHGVIMKTRRPVEEEHRYPDSEALVLYTIGMLTESMRNRASSRRK